jgi:hypothetical protein
VHEKIVAWLDATLEQSCCHTQNASSKVAVCPYLPLTLKWLPHEKRVISSRLSPKVEKPIHISPGKWIELTAYIILQAWHRMALGAEGSAWQDSGFNQ